MLHQLNGGYPVARIKPKLGLFADYTVITWDNIGGDKVGVRRGMMANQLEKKIDKEMEKRLGNTSHLWGLLKRRSRTL